MDLGNLLAAKGLRSSTIRMAVLAVLAEQTMDGSYVTADLVYEALHARGIPLNMPGVYRTLSHLAESQLILRRRVGTGKSTYALCHGAAPTGHTLCRSCGAVRQLEDRMLTDRLRELAAEQGFETQDIAVEVQGICAACAA